MKNLIDVSVAIITLFLSIATVTGFGQSPAATPTPSATPKISEETQVIKVDSRLVVVPVSVTDEKGGPVTGLKTVDFKILEEKRPQSVESVSDADKVPLDIALLFDISATTSPMFRFQQETAGKFLRQVMKDKDRAAIFTVGSKPAIVQPFGSAEQSIASLATIVATKEQTAFYDSITRAVSYLRQSSPEGRRRVILIISDGEDTNSEGVLKAIWAAERKIADSVQGEELRSVRVKARDNAKSGEQNKVLKSLQDADTVFYSINPAGSSYLLNQMSVFGQENMQRFATETGGSAFLPKFQPIDTKDELQNSGNMRRNTALLENIFRQLANELQAQYLIQYYSDAEFPTNKFVKLDVGLTNPANRRIRARRGYYVKN